MVHWIQPRLGNAAATLTPTPSLGGDRCEYFEGVLVPRETVRVYGCGCASDRGNGIEVAVCGCELHARCITTVGGDRLSDDTVKRCAFCSDKKITRKD